MNIWDLGECFLVRECPSPTYYKNSLFEVLSQKQHSKKKQALSSVSNTHNFSYPHNISFNFKDVRDIIVDQPNERLFKLSSIFFCPLCKGSSEICTLYKGQNGWSLWSFQSGRVKFDHSISLPL